MNATRALYRPLREEELPEATNVFVVTVNDLLKRSGLPPSQFTLENRLDYYRHILKTGIFYVAEIDGKIAAVSAAVVRGKQWFLCAFWTLPQYQGQKIGRPLLAKVWEEGRAQGALLSLTWSSIDFSALTSYLGLEMLPQTQIFTFSGKAELPAASASATDIQPLDPSEADRLDLEMRGALRGPEDRAFFERNSITGRQVVKNGSVIGYYCYKQGTIGPAAWVSDEAARAVLSTAFREAAAQGDELRVPVLGQNTAALRAALEHKLRLTGSAHLLASAPFGAISRYIPSGPLLF